MGHLALQPSLDCQSQDSGVGFITGLSSSTEPNFTSGSILQELLTFADVGLSAAVCGRYEVGTVQLYSSPPLPSGIGCPSQCCNRNAILGSRLGLLTVCRTGGGQELGWIADPLVEPRWALSRHRAGAVGTATSAGGLRGNADVHLTTGPLEEKYRA